MNFQNNDETSKNESDAESLLRNSLQEIADYKEELETLRSGDSDYNADREDELLDREEFIKDELELLEKNVKIAEKAIAEERTNTENSSE